MKKLLLTTSAILFSANLAFAGGDHKDHHAISQEGAIKSGADTSKSGFFRYSCSSCAPERPIRSRFT